MLTTKTLTFLCVASLAGCSGLLRKNCNTSDHSCPEPGHGPCYLCDTPERDGSSNYGLSKVR